MHLKVILNKIFVMYNKAFFYLLVLFLILSCSSNSGDEGTPDVANRLPIVSNIQVELIGTNPFVYEFSITASDPDNDPLTFSWNFGDGTTKSGSATESHEFVEGDTYSVNVTVSDGVTQNVIRSATANTVIIQLTIDKGITYQTIDGFGGFGSQKPWWGSAPFYDADFIDQLINDLGVSILRDNIPWSFEPENDNDDPLVTDLSKFNITQDVDGADSHLGQHLPYLKAMADAGVDKIIASVWSPPLWMKHINHRGNGIDDPNASGAFSAPPYTDNPDENTNQLRTDMYAEFAEYLVTYVKTVKAETGIDIYALSIQNEPIFSQFYASCVYNAEAYRDVLKVVGKRFEDEGMNTKFFGQEDVAIFDRIEQYINTINADPEARGYLDIFAIHNYSDDGISASDEGPQNWENSRAIADANGQDLWMSETSGFSNDWEGAHTLGKSIYNALKFGKINAWVYWQMSENGNGNGVFINSGNNTKKYYVSKHYYKYIRPGAVQVESSSEDDQVLVLAFTDSRNGTETVIVINNDTEQKVVKIGDGTSSYDIYTSSENQNFEEDIEVEGAFVLPAKSIVTLHSD